MKMKNDTKVLDKKIKKEIKTGNVKSAIELCQIGLQKDPTNADLHQFCNKSHKNQCKIPMQFGTL